jgi:multidrug transporter EmrE-like cation transporter
MQFAGLITIYTLISAFGLYKIKAADGVYDIVMWLGAAAYGAGFLLWLVILRKYALSIAFPIAAGSLIIATQAVSYLFLKETLSTAHLAGVALIIAGITIVFARA